MARAQRPLLTAARQSAPAATVRRRLEDVRTTKLIRSVGDADLAVDRIIDEALGEAGTSDAS